VAGQNVAIEYRWADGHYERLPALAVELVRLGGSRDCREWPCGTAGKTATTTIPIVFTAGFDPIELGLIASLSRPGGNHRRSARISCIAATELSPICAVFPRNGRASGALSCSRSQSSAYWPARSRTALYGLRPCCRDLFRNGGNRRGGRRSRTDLVDCARHRSRRYSPSTGLHRRKRSYVRCSALPAVAGLERAQPRPRMSATCTAVHSPPRAVLPLVSEAERIGL
jgi:hypothetical protein